MNAVVLDHPVYRSQEDVLSASGGRVGPVLGGGGGRVGLCVVNVIAMGLGTWAVAVLAVEMGLSFMVGSGLPAQHWAGQ